MSSPNQQNCRLCLNNCDGGYCDLYDEMDGDNTTTTTNEVFDMVRKYFSNEFLDTEFCRHLTKLCLNCWHYIEEFNKFQESIILAHENMKMTHVSNIIEEIEEECYEEIPIKFEEFNITEIDAPNVEGDGKGHEANDLEEDVDDFIMNTMESLGANIDDDGKENVADIQAKNDDDDDEDNEDHDHFITEIMVNIDAVENVEELQTIEEYDKIIAEWKRNLECVLCYQKFLTFSLLALHFDEKHPREVAHIICCGTKLQQHVQIVEHIEYHKTINELKCNICHIRFASRASTKRHFQQQHGEEIVGQFPRQVANKKKKFKIFKCKICHKMFLENSTIKAHYEAEHQIDSELFCEFCSERFLQKTEYQRHLNQQHLEEWQMKRNQEAIEMLPEIRRRMAGAKLAQQNIDELPRKTAQNSQIENPPSSTSTGDCKCWICDKTFHSKRYLMAHMTLHEGNEAAMHHCKYCSKSYHLPSSLSHHIRLKHRKPETTVESLKCDICNKTYYTQKALREHRSKHEGKPLSRCPICHKEYYLSSSLSSHMKKHHSSENFKGLRIRRDLHSTPPSEAAENTTTRPSNSTERASYKCQTCGKIYQSSRSLREHESKHYGNKAYSCHFCTSKFYLKSSMYTHMKTNHYYQYQNFKKTSSTKQRTQMREKVEAQQQNITNLDDLVKSLDIEQQQQTENVTAFSSCSPAKSPKKPLVKTEIPEPEVTQLNIKIPSPATTKKSSSQRGGKVMFGGLKCHKCGNVYQSIRSLREHLAKHSGKPLYACKFCGQKFFLKSSMSQHIKMKHKSSNNKGETPQCTTSEIYLLPKGNGEEEEEVETIMEVETIENTTIDSGSSSSSYSPVSRKSTRNLRNRQIKTDPLTHSPPPPPQRNTITAKPIGRENCAFKCLKCNRRYQSKRTLLAHQQVRHEGKKAFSCKFCSKIFGLKTSMYNHLRLFHPQERLAEKINSAENLLNTNVIESDQPSMICDILNDYLES
ncbi:uncharacterized protein [Musca autumnalis]|uniref:uncharacterized protein n=1 Tax=Musca autumnalis TaxID=221902 RepID=UPI003CEC36B1